MAEDIGSLVVKIMANTQDLDRGLQQVSGKVNNFGSSLKKIGGIMAGAFAIGAITKFTGKMVNAASDAAEMQSKFSTVFANMSKDAEAWATTFRNKVGGSRVEIKGMLADSQDMLTGFGATTEQAFDFSTKMQSLGTDLASFQNLQGGASEAVERLRKGLLGETENLKAMGIVINENVMYQELALQGDTRKIKELSELEKIELRYTIAVKQSKNAIGDAEKTSGGYVNQMRNLKGLVADATASLGTFFLPVMTKMVTFIADKIPMIQNMFNNAFTLINDVFTAMKPTIDAFINALKIGFEFIRTKVIPPLAKKFQEWGPTITAIFEGLWDVIGPILNLLVAGFKFAWPFISQVVSTAATIISGIISGVLKVLKGVIDFITGVFTGDWSKAWGGIRQIFSGIWTAISSTFTGIKNLLVTVGRNLINGLWEGIKNSASSFKTRMINFITDAIPNTVKKLLGITSPSKVMAQYGRMVSEGLALGIKEASGKVKDMAGLLAQNVIDTMGKVSTQLSLTTQMAQARFDLFVASMGKSANQAKILQAQINMLTTQIDVSKDKVKLLEISYNDLKTTKGELAEETRNTYLELLKEQTNQANLENQLKDTNAALEKQNRLLDDTVSKAGTIRGKFLTDMANAQSEYASRVAEANRMLTEDLAEAQGKYTDKVAEANIRMSEALERAEKNYNDRVTSAQDELRKAEESLTRAYETELGKRTSALTDWIGLFDAMPDKAQVTGKELLGNLQEQVTGFERWQELITQLSGKTIDEGLIAELQAMGPRAINEIASLNELTDDELSDYVRLWRDKNRLAKEQALFELAPLKSATEHQIEDLRIATAQKLVDYKNEWVAAQGDIRRNNAIELEGLRTDWLTEVENIRIKTNEKLEGYKTDWDNAVKEIKEGVLSTLKTLVEEAEGEGMNFVQALIDGMIEKMPELQGAISQVAAAMGVTPSVAAETPSSSGLPVAKTAQELGTLKGQILPKLGLTPEEYDNLIQEALNGSQVAKDALANLNMAALNLGSIPKFAKGIAYVPANMLAFLHKGERVVPAADNQANSRASTPATPIIDYVRLGKVVASEMVAALRATPLQAVTILDGQKVSKGLWPNLVDEKLRLGVATL